MIYDNFTAIIESKEVTIISIRLPLKMMKLAINEIRPALSHIFNTCNRSVYISRFKAENPRQSGVRNWK